MIKRERDPVKHTNHRRERWNYSIQPPHSSTKNSLQKSSNIDNISQHFGIGMMVRNVLKKIASRCPKGGDGPVVSIMCSLPTADAIEQAQRGVFVYREEFA